MTKENVNSTENVDYNHPHICPRCGAPMNDTICEYCGTTYSYKSEEQLSMRDECDTENEEIAEHTYNYENMRTIPLIMAGMIMITATPLIFSAMKKVPTFSTIDSEICQIIENVIHMFTPLGLIIVLFGIFKFVIAIRNN